MSPNPITTLAALAVAISALASPQALAQTTDPSIPVGSLTAYPTVVQTGTKPNRPQDLLSQSDILCFDGLATLVPKHAIMQIPETCAERLKIQPGAKIVGWADFFAANRGWITTIEISRVQAEGNEPVAEDTRKMMTQCRNLIVATYLGGPISLLPPKVPPPEKLPSAATPTEKTKP